MDRRGFTVIELLVAVAVMGLLTALGTVQFNNYMKKAQITSQTRTLYGELMQYRIKAFHEKRNWTFKFTASGYGIYSSANVAVSPVRSVELKHNVISSDTDNVTFDGHGGSTAAAKTVCVESSNDATVDSVVISTSRVLIGKKDEGSCDSDHITAQ
ncbi:pilus assembly FimT family protein [Geomonas propionica]|uniref:Prepilin-type N-terminal cleavage/methylation domain-containing protein n=1 Tax=Geomonas propionica TaxID=2798582 RepID=A0ABS0YVS6_9BACT|nr:prepilin-type N-terminal cleavage/methylation domain-containing protein [Geomonas propionica]MBJ6801872.1 prepilin-type N-terminal cleavage/methylation domain-containing protein [Geomonas propionica]